MRALFVTGTDTGVGKTFVSLALVAAWRDAGLRVGVMKPAETGCRPAARPSGQPGSEEPREELLPADAGLLLRESRTALTLDEVCPFRFRLPMAPAEAAAAEGRGEVSIDRCVQIFRRIRGNHDVTIVEGAGGLLVPYEKDRTAADLAKAMDLPVLVVARTALGTINHTCLTVETCRCRGLEVAGVVFTRAEDPAVAAPGPDEQHNPAAVERIARVKVFGKVPFIPGGDFRKARGFIDCDGLLAAL